MNKLWKKWIARMLAASMVCIALPMPANRALAEETATGSTISSTGETTFGIVSVKTGMDISFTVPLYATLAVVGNSEDDNAKVYQPAQSAYKIVNRSKGKIGVVGISVKNNLAGTWSLSKTVPTDDPRSMQLKVGKVILPNLATSSQAQTTVTVPQSDLYGEGSVFGSSNKPTAIDANAEQELLFEGEVAPGWKTLEGNHNLAATPQWVVTYTLSPIDGAGNPMVSYTYSGDARYFVWDSASNSFTTEGAFEQP